MCVNDIACAGGEPLFFLDYIACGKNEPVKIARIVSGVAEGLGVAVLPLPLIQPALSAGTVSQFWVAGIRFARRFRLLHHRNKYLTRPMEVMIQLCRQAWE